MKANHKNKMHRQATSNTTLKSINRSKYNKVILSENTYPDPRIEYEIKSDGWRRRKVGVK